MRFFGAKRAKPAVPVPTNRPLLTLLSLLVVAGCFDCVTEISARRELDEAMFFYQRDLRWQRFSQAADRVDPALREAFIDRCSHLSTRLNINSVEIIDVKLDDDSEAATIRVRYAFVMSPSVTVETVLLKERWVRQDGKWVLLEGALPMRFSEAEE